MSEIKQSDLRDEDWREYNFVLDAATGNGRRVYRVNSPVTLFTRPGGTTHRVLDANGIVHCVPAVGERGCVLSWKPKNPATPVAF